MWGLESILYRRHREHAGGYCVVACSSIWPLESRAKPTGCYHDSYCETHTVHLRERPILMLKDAKAAEPQITVLGHPLATVY